ncbi:hypothetical protein D3C80_1995460 [compost metagenome]
MTASNSTTTTLEQTSNLNGVQRGKRGRVSIAAQKIMSSTTTKILEEKLSIANKKIQLLNRNVANLQTELVHFKQYFASMYHVP